MVDSDLRSITADWVKYLLEPVLEKNYLVKVWEEKSSEKAEAEA